MARRPKKISGVHMVITSFRYRIPDGDEMQMARHSPKAGSS